MTNDQSMTVPTSLASIVLPREKLHPSWLQSRGRPMSFLYGGPDPPRPSPAAVETKGQRMAVHIRLPPAGLAILA